MAGYSLYFQGIREAVRSCFGRHFYFKGGSRGESDVTFGLKSESEHTPKGRGGNGGYVSNKLSQVYPVGPALPSLHLPFYK